MKTQKCNSCGALKGRLHRPNCRHNGSPDSVVYSDASGGHTYGDSGGGCSSSNDNGSSSSSCGGGE